LLDDCFEGVGEEGVRDGIGVLDFYCFRGCCFGDVGDGFLACAVNGGEVDDLVSGLERKVAQDGIDARGGIWDVCDCFDWSIEVLGNCSSRFVQQFGVFVADEFIRSGFSGVLV